MNLRRTTIWIWKCGIVLGILSVVLLDDATAQELRKERGRYVTEIKKDFKVSATGSLQMRDITGDVEVKAGKADKVKITEKIVIDVFTEEEANRVLQASKASYSQSGDRIFVDGSGRARRVINSNFYVSVPPSFSLDISTKGGDLKILRVEGDIELSTAGGDIVISETGGEVRAKTSGGDVKVSEAAGRVTVKTSGGEIELEHIKGEVDAKTSGGSILIRGAEKPAILKTSGGNIEIYEVNASLSASTSGGDIRVDNTAGDVEVHTSGGDITLRRIQGEVEASTSGGDVRGKGLHGAGRLKTSGGDIRIRDLTARLEAATSGGEVDVEMTLTDFSKPHDLSLSSSGGDIRLTIPEELPAKIFAEIRLKDGWHFGKRYDIESDFPLKIDRGKEEERGGRSLIRGQGEINGGGDPITLKTRAGNIIIRKLR